MKLQVAHEVSLRELDIKAKQAPETSNNDGSIPAVHIGEKRVDIPKDLKLSFVVGCYQTQGWPRDKQEPGATILYEKQWYLRQRIYK